jgi:hypothetical protein
LEEFLMTDSVKINPKFFDPLKVSVPALAHELDQTQDGDEHAQIRMVSHRVYATMFSVYRGIRYE